MTTVSIDAPDGQSAIHFANDAPIAVMGGMNVLESADLAAEVAEAFIAVTTRLNIPYIFKASYDKANRSSLTSYRGPGLDAGLRILADIKARFGVPVITDVHEPCQAEAVAEVADILQLPAFLARQTDLVTAIARAGKPVHIKKPQFLAPQEMAHILTKCADAGNDQVILCERGSAFGYNNLVVDMLGVDLMRPMAPVTFDVTHALQRPGGLAHGAGGRREQFRPLMRAGLGVGLAGLFIEAHPDPDQAKCDGPCALRLDMLDAVLSEAVAIDTVVKAHL